MQAIRSFRPLIVALALVAGASFAAGPALAQDHGKAVEASKDAHGHDAHATGAAHDDHGHAPPAGVLPTVSQGIAPMVVSLIVFALVLAVLGKTAWPKITKGLKDREEKIASEIEAAEMAQQKAKAALQEYEKNLAQARAEAQKMLDTAKAEQQAIAAELKAKSEIELNAMRDKAKRDIDAAKRAALSEIYESAGALATSMATKILKREINANDQQRLVQESLGELQAAVAGSN